MTGKGSTFSNQLGKMRSWGAAAPLAVIATAIVCVSVVRLTGGRNSELLPLVSLPIILAVVSCTFERTVVLGLVVSFLQLYFQNPGSFEITRADAIRALTLNTMALVGAVFARSVLKERSEIEQERKRMLQTMEEKDALLNASQIVKGNTTQHTMQVIRDGQQIADYPVSYGLDSDPGRVTHSGVHVVMSKHATYSMSNPRYNYTDVNVPWAVRISNNGEFIHGLAASVWAQGKKNVSHGCLNLSPARAKEYFDGVLTGDPVEITGSTQTLTAEDGDYSDWTYDWASWQKLSALAR